jgi:pilus assembly protein Flp/PilA
MATIETMIHVYPLSLIERRYPAMLYHSPREKGQGLMEYALILVLLAIVVIAVLVLFGPTLGNMYSRVTNLFPSS